MWSTAADRQQDTPYSDHLGTLWPAQPLCPARDYRKSPKHQQLYIYNHLHSSLVWTYKNANFRFFANFVKRVFSKKETTELLKYAFCLHRERKFVKINWIRGFPPHSDIWPNPPNSSNFSELTILFITKSVFKNSGPFCFVFRKYSLNKIRKKLEIRVFVFILFLALLSIL